MKNASLARTALAIPVLLSLLSVGQAAPKPTPKPLTSNRPYTFRLPRAASRLLPSVPHGPGDQIPPCFMVFGLRSGPHGATFTDKYGNSLPLQSSPKTTWTFTTRK